MLLCFSRMCKYEEFAYADDMSILVYFNMLLRTPRAPKIELLMLTQDLALKLSNAMYSVS